MKVLRIVSLGYIAGGAENGIVKLHPYLLDRGHSVKILASNLGADKKHFNDYTFKSINSTNPLKLLFFLFNPSSFFALRKILKEYQPDIVHLHTMNQITPSVLFLLKKHPTVMTLHGPETFLRNLLLWFLLPAHFKQHFYDQKDLNLAGKFTYFYFNSIQKVLYNIGLKNVDIFIAPSKSMQNLAEADVSPIVHVPNFIELRTFHALKNNYNVLFVGRLEQMKGIELLIQALPSIIPLFPQTTLTIIGDGSSKTDLLDLTTRLQLEQYVHFTGWVENKDLDSYYEKASIVVMPSIVAESFGGVILEAMSVGRPVIATKVGGIPEIIDDGVDGYLVEPKNSEQIAEKIIQLFSDEELLIVLGRNARKKAEGFSIEKYAESMEKIYGTVIDTYKTIRRPQSILQEECEVS
ncbi:glycosyltransferase family 4 protein [Ktedonobacteria bacterium brp13]|nr:glycosyltransferase family 4 protein [Ktedonobacteria bacterium brp13]